MKFIKSNSFKISELALALILVIGSFTVFAACGVSKEHVMSCHYAQLAVTLLGAVLLIQSLLSLAIRDKKISLGLTLSQIPVTIAVFFVPGTFFSLCMMNTMRCITIFQPAVRVVDAILFIVASVDIVLDIRKNGEVKKYAHKETAA